MLAAQININDGSWKFWTSSTSKKKNAWAHGVENPFAHYHERMILFRDWQKRKTPFNADDPNYIELGLAHAEEDYRYQGVHYKPYIAYMIRKNFANILTQFNSLNKTKHRYMFPDLVNVLSGNSWAQIRHAERSSGCCCY